MILIYLLLFSIPGLLFGCLCGLFGWEWAAILFTAFPILLVLAALLLNAPILGLLALGFFPVNCITTALSETTGRLVSKHRLFNRLLDV